jgi:hypothetical protein
MIYKCIEQKALILQFFKHIDLAQHLPKVFLKVPEFFVERFVRFVCIEGPKRDVDLAAVLQQVDKAVFIAIVYEIERLALSTTEVKPVKDSLT